MFRYRYGGLVFQSTKPLPLMPDEAGAGPADVTVEFGPLPRPAAAAVRAKPHFQMYGDGSAILQSPQSIRMLFDKGRILRLEAPEGVDPGIVRSWLVGPGLGLILSQRGAPSLHACAVSLAGRAVAVAVAGDSGAGKSTAARALLQRGHRLLAEDQAVIDPASRLLHPGVPDLRLRAETARWFGDGMEEGAWVGSEGDKFTVPSLRDRFDPHPRLLAAVFVLASDPAERPTADPPTTERPTTERLSAVAAAAALHRYVYRQRLAGFMGLSPGIFRWATALAAAVPVFVLRRPKDLSRLDELAAYIERTTERTP